jgi:hypothetical protein
MSAKRFTFNVLSGGLWESQTGEWVRHEAHRDEVRVPQLEVDRLKDEVERLRAAAAYVIDCWADKDEDALPDAVDRLRAAVEAHLAGKE